jgi:hypothetical protein
MMSTEILLRIKKGLNLITLEKLKKSRLTSMIKQVRKEPIQMIARENTIIKLIKEKISSIEIGRMGTMNKLKNNIREAIIIHIMIAMRNLALLVVIPVIISTINKMKVNSFKNSKRDLEKNKNELSNKMRDLLQMKMSLKLYLSVF